VFAGMFVRALYSVVLNISLGSCPCLDRGLGIWCPPCLQGSVESSAQRHSGTFCFMLYALTPPVLNIQAFLPVCAAVFEVGVITHLQLRLKPFDQQAIISAAAVLKPLCAAHHVKLILNDSPALAAQLGVDGVHIGAEDGDYVAARNALPQGIVGITCYNMLDRALAAANAGADYVAFGAFYPSQTKVAKTAAAPDLIRRFKALSRTPVAAIGGITPENAAPLLHAGADLLAVTAGLWEYPEGAVAAAKAFQACKR
jgi:thiamine-phosphate pyrophosphorylase